MDTLSSGTEAKLARPKAPMWLISVVVLVLLSFAANRESMRCTFFSDDFLCLDYLFKTWHGHPELFLQRLVSPWQDPSVNLLYRPVCDLFFFLDFALWQSKAAGYHLTNLCVHSSVAVLLFFCVKRLFGAQGLSGARVDHLATLAAAIFAVYPIHVEPIVWICGRADLLAAGFLLASFLLSMKNFQSEKSSAGALALALYFIALLSKEASVCGVAIIFFYLLILQSDKHKFVSALRTVVPFIGVTIAYFVIRFLILGTLLGGYTGSLGDVLRTRWDDLTLSMDVPLILGLASNLALFKANNPIIITLHLVYLILAVVLVLRAALAPWDGKTGRLLAFLAVAAVCAILPAIQVIGLSAVLTNSRVFYLAGSFYIPFFIIALIPSKPSSKKIIQVASGVAFLACWIAVLVFLIESNGTYAPWLEASVKMRSLQAAVHAQLLKTDNGKKLIVIIPYTNYMGAHWLYEFSEVQTLVGPAFFTDDHSEKLMALTSNPTFSASTTRLHRLLSDSLHYDVFFFDFDHEKLNRVREEAPLTSAGPLSPDRNPCQLVEIESPQSSDRAYFVNLPQAVQIDDSSQIELTVAWKEAGIDRLCSSVLSTGARIDDESRHSCYISEHRKCTLTYHFSSFELRKVVCEQAASKLYVQMPAQCQLISAFLISGKDTAVLQPDLHTVVELKNGNYTPAENSVARLNLDVSQVKGATGMMLERAKPDYVFKITEVCARDPQAYENLDRIARFNSTTANYFVAASELNPKHRYSYRLIALDKNGASIGFYSDTVSIDLRPSALQQ